MQEKFSGTSKVHELTAPVPDRYIFILFRPSVLVWLIYLLLLGCFGIVHHYTVFDFIHLGTVWGAHNPKGTWGYDGQFYYQIARNPLSAAHYMDSAAYRYQHLLYGLLAWALSFGQIPLIPYAL